LPNIIRCGSTTNGTLAKQITNFYATIGDTKVVLTWNKPSDSNYSGVAIVRKTGGYPQRVLDGTKVYEGTGTSFSDTGLTNGTQYYYRAFAYNSHHEYQTAYCVATMTPLHGYQLGTFPVGTKVEFGSLYGSKIVWRIANKSGSSITLITDGVVALYAFDAKEPSNPNKSRQNYGNNRYRYSNIRRWLNSEAGAGSWYSAQYSYDHSPNSTDVVSANPYSSEAGFLNAWTTKEKNYLETTTRTVGKSDTDGGGTESLSDRIWLPSGTEMGLSTDFVEGSRLSEFSSDSDRTAYITDAAASHFSVSSSHYWYWLRTPYASSANLVRGVDTGGSLYDSNADNGGGGARPLCVLDSSVLVSLTVDSDGCYTLA
jgi:hypothetical protein